MVVCMELKTNVMNTCTLNSSMASGQTKCTIISAKRCVNVANYDI